MKKLLVIAGLLLLCGSMSLAQDTPAFEIYGGYSYMHVESAGSGQGLGTDGWEASANWNWNHWLGLKADFDGNYCCNGQHLYTFLFGPQISLRRPKFTFFVHGLVGGAHAQGLVTTDTDLGYAFGGGLDWNVNRWLAIRAPQVDYVGTRFLSSTQNDVRVSGGLVFKLGRK